MDKRSTGHLLSDTNSINVINKNANFNSNPNLLITFEDVIMLFDVYI